MSGCGRNGVDVSILWPPRARFQSVGQVFLLSRCQSTATLDPLDLAVFHSLAHARARAPRAAPRTDLTVPPA